MKLPKAPNPYLWIAAALFIAACCTPAIRDEGWPHFGHDIYGAQCLLIYVAIPMWLANPLVLAGAIALGYRRVALAVGLSGVGLACAITLFCFGGVQDMLVGSWLWLASIIVVLAGSYATEPRRLDS
jgi:hypothetical protein